MPARLLCLALIASALAAGCVSPAATSEQVAAASAAPAPVVLEWSGRIAVGAAYEAPAHFPETAAASQALWDAMVNLDVRESPSDLLVELEWTGAPGSQVQLMVNAPWREDGWPEWTTPFSGEARQCVRVAAQDLEPGLWYAMAHTSGGADIDFTLRFTLVGGAAEVRQEHASWPTFAQYAGTKVEMKASEPCEPSA